MNENSKHFVIQLSFPSGAPPDEAQRAQRGFLTELHAEGALLLAGRFMDERGGGMSIIRGDSLEAARARFSESPLVKGGHVDWDVREWNVTVGAEAV